jgi:hypothetical protein
MLHQLHFRGACAFHQPGSKVWRCICKVIKVYFTELVWFGLTAAGGPSSPPVHSERHRLEALRAAMPPDDLQSRHNALKSWESHHSETLFRLELLGIDLFPETSQMLPMVSISSASECLHESSGYMLISSPRDLFNVLHATRAT